MEIDRDTYMGVEVLARLAACAPQGGCSSLTLAEWIDQPASYTQALLGVLVTGGLVRMRLGSPVCYELAGPAARISVADIFEAFDDAPSGPRNGSGDLDGTSGLWQSLKSHILLCLSSISLADISPDTEETLDHECESGGPRKHANERGIEEGRS